MIRRNCLKQFTRLIWKLNINEMRIINANISDIKFIETDVAEDNRGYFSKIYNEEIFNKLIGNYNFVEEFYSYNNDNIIRGLHYQLDNSESKLISILNGAVFDVAVDLRKSSPNFGKWVSTILNRKRQIWIPSGFAHGFYTLVPDTIMLYKVTSHYNKEKDRVLLWNDEYINIKWPILNNISPITSERDAKGIPFSIADYFL